jgi:hypothetical protein
MTITPMIPTPPFLFMSISNPVGTALNRRSFAIDSGNPSPGFETGSVDRADAVARSLTGRLGILASR